MCWINIWGYTLTEWHEIWICIDISRFHVNEGICSGHFVEGFPKDKAKVFANGSSSPQLATIAVLRRPALTYELELFVFYKVGKSMLVILFGEDKVWIVINGILDQT